MIDLPSSRLLWPLAIGLPWLFRGAGLHRAALLATARGAFPAAEALFESAAGRYRADLEVEGLARLRVHQLIARARALPGSLRDATTILAIEQRLIRLQRINSLVPPFELVPASQLLAIWLEERQGAPAADHEAEPLRNAA